MDELGVNVLAVKSRFLMKKTYVHQLINRKGDIAFHIRLKGVPADVIVNEANRRFPQSIQCTYRDGLVFPIDSPGDGSYSIMKLYEFLYDGGEIEFDLCKGSKPCFDMKGFEISTKASFKRLIKL